MLVWRMIFVPLSEKLTCDMMQSPFSIRFLVTSLTLASVMVGSTTCFEKSILGVGNLDLETSDTEI